MKMKRSIGMALAMVMPLCLGACASNRPCYPQGGKDNCQPVGHCNSAQQNCNPPQRQAETCTTQGTCGNTTTVEERRVHNIYTPPSIYRTDVYPATVSSQGCGTPNCTNCRR